jgi:hypothetical protein
MLFSFYSQLPKLKSFSQDAVHGGTDDLQAAGDLGFTCARAVELLDLAGVDGRCHLPAQLLAVLPSFSQTSARPLAKNLPSELGKDRQQPRNGPAGGSNSL